MKAIVLAGGFGTRLRPLTDGTPKPLLPVAGRPCIDYVLRSLRKAGCREIIVTTSYMSDRVMEQIGNGQKYDASIQYSLEATPAGTAGAVKRVADLIEDTFVVASGDVLADVDVGELYEFHRRKAATATLALTRVKDPSQFGIVELNDTQQVIRFLEKPSQEETFSDLVNAGIYVLEPEVTDVIPEREMFDFSKDVFPRLLKKDVKVYGQELGGLWMDIGRPRDLWRASIAVIEREGSDAAHEGVKIRGPVMLSAKAMARKGVEIEGPSYVGVGATLGSDTRIRRSCIYDGVVLDREVVVEDSIVMEGTRIGSRSVVRDSVISRGCTVEEDVRLTSSVLGDGMTLRPLSRLEGESVPRPAE